MTVINEKIINSHILKDAEIVLPPEYHLSEDRWSELIKDFSDTNREICASYATTIYARRLNVDIRGGEMVLMGDIRKVGDKYFMDVEFSKNDAGRLLLLVHHIQNLSFVAICLDGSSATRMDRIVPTYLPTL